MSSGIARALFEVSQHDASKKKKAGGRPSDHNEKRPAGAWGDQKMTATQRQKEYETERGIGRAAFFKLLKSLDNSGLVQKLQNPEKLKKHGFLEQKFGRFRNWFLNLPSYSIWQQALQGLLPKFSKYRNL